LSLEYNLFSNKIKPMAVRKTAKKETRTERSTDRDLLKFQISEIRKDKIVYAVESTALTILALLVFIGAPSVFPEIINPYEPSSLKILQGVIILPFVYWLLVAVIGNLLRLRKINKLQRELMSSK